MLNFPRYQWKRLCQSGSDQTVDALGTLVSTYTTVSDWASIWLPDYLKQQHESLVFDGIREPQMSSAARKLYNKLRTIRYKMGAASSGQHIRCCTGFVSTSCIAVLVADGSAKVSSLIAMTSCDLVSHGRDKAGLLPPAWW